MSLPNVRPGRPNRHRRVGGLAALHLRRPTGDDVLNQFQHAM